MLGGGAPLPPPTAGAGCLFLLCGHAVDGLSLLSRRIFLLAHKSGKAGDWRGQNLLPAADRLLDDEHLCSPPSLTMTPTFLGFVILASERATAAPADEHCFGPRGRLLAAGGGGVLLHGLAEGVARVVRRMTAVG